MTLTSPRLILRQWGDENFAPFWAMAQDKKVMEFLLPLPTRNESDANALSFRDHIETHGFGFWVIEVPDVAPFIGFAGLLNVSDTNPFYPAVEIGWRLARPYWGKGYASEAATAALTFGFNTLRLNEIIAFTVSANLRSQAVMQRIGMTRNPADDFDHPGVPDGSPLKQHVLYRKSRLG
ncbi:MAG: GNAT family N-acetyltransferase [Pseudomonadota bacterium]